MMKDGKGGSSGVPEGWQSKKLSEIAKVERGKFSARPRNDPKYYGGTIPFVQTGDVTSANGRIERFTQTLNEDGLKVSKLFPKSTILVTIAANIGDVAMTTFPVACPDSLVAVRANDNVSNTWLFYFLQTQKDELDSASTQNAQKNINLQVLNPLEVKLPPLEEQRKIAEILSAWDEAIEQQTRLVELKRERKRGLMQQLLTGRVRFREFAGLEWKNIELDEIIEVNPRKQLEGLSFVGEFVEMASVSEQGQLEHVAQTELSGSLNGFTAFCNDDVLVAKITPCFENGKGAFVFGLRGLGLGSTEFHVLRARREILPLYLYFLTRSYEFQQRGKASMQGSGGQQRVPTDFIKKFPVSLPPLPEQQEIATVLSAADAEIDTLTAQLAALKTQKRGLMQRLLTGQTRVSVA